MGEIGVFRLNCGSCNGCDIEIIGALASRFGLAKLGVGVVEGPEEAEVFILTGVVSAKMKGVLKRVREKLRSPKAVVAVGTCALSRGAFEGSYSVAEPTDELVDVDAYVPGCPPSPQAIAHALATVLKSKFEVWPVPEGFRGVPEVDSEKCTGCGACVQVCPAGAVELVDDGDKRSVKFRCARCIFCAACEENCPEEAIRLAIERPRLTLDKAEMETKVEVELQRCSNCGKPFAPSRQLERATETVVENVEEYRQYRDEIFQRATICLDCRELLGNMRKSKGLLLKLTRAVQPSL